MSFNLRYDTIDDKENSWDFRKDSVAALIMQYRPDILGIQEGLSHMISFLKEKLPLYKYWGKGRQFFNGEQCGLFFRRDMFLKIDGGHFWLSSTPEKQGSTSFGNETPRMCSYLKLKYKRPEFLKKYLKN